MKRFYDVIQDEAGNIVPGAELYVRDQGDNSLVTLYSDDGTTETANPATSGTDGYVDFYTADNTLKLEVYVDGELDRTIEQFQHFDLDNITAFIWTLLDDATASAARTTLGATTVGGNLFTLANPGAITFPRLNADNTATALSASDFRTAIGAGVGGGDLVAANNLSDVAAAATAATNLGLGTGSSPQFTAVNIGHASDTTVTRVSAGVIAVEGVTILTTAYRPTESIIIACSDESTAITTGTAKVTFRMPYAFTVTDVRASVNTAPTGSTILIDINEGGTTILSTKLMIDASEKTSTTAATPAVISDASLADDAEITIDFDQVGSSIAGKGVKVTLIGTRT